MIRIEGIEIEQGHFPDNSLMLKLQGEVYDKINEENIFLEWKYESDAELFTVICLRKHFAKRKMVLYMPYCPHARMDRVKSICDVFTLKHFADVINSLDFNFVLCADVHSSVAAALINNFYEIGQTYSNIRDTFELIKNASDDNAIVCYPDEGAMKRYSDIISAPYVFGVKKRDWGTGKIMGLDLMNKELIVGKDVLIVDDICSRGGTFYHTAKALKEAGANRVYLYVTHCEKTILEGDLPGSGLIEQVFTTDSLFPDDIETDFIAYIDKYFN